ncbi:putative Mannose-binding lectin [Seiridium cardinale]|uniref:Mannose-binding lectin n=1 Tax=Seiridium cardinale TaxID=138064 RepID=A0ABR2XLC8_9PEZI
MGYNLIWQWEKEVNSAQDQFELLAIYYSGQQDIEYKGTLNVVTDDDHKFSCSTSGTLSQVLVSNVEIKARRYGTDGEVEEKTLKSYAPQSLEASGKASAKNEDRLLDHNDNGVESNDEELRYQDEQISGEQQEDYAENDDSTELGKGEDSAAYDVSHNAEPDYQTTTQSEENTADDYDQAVVEDSLKPDYGNSFDNQEEIKDCNADYNEGAEEQTFQSDYDQEADNRHIEGETYVERPTEEPESTYDEGDNRYEDEIYEEKAEMEPQQLYEEDAEVPSSPVQDEFRQWQNYGSNYESQGDELDERDARNQYDISEHEGYTSFGSVSEEQDTVNGGSYGESW